MEYTIRKLSKLAGVSTRTLRYYDEIGLLGPRSKNGSGYRIYGEKEVDKLQDILFFRELGFELKKIAVLINDTDYNRLNALRNHFCTLNEQKKAAFKIDFKCI